MSNKLPIYSVARPEHARIRRRIRDHMEKLGYTEPGHFVNYLEDLMTAYNEGGFNPGKNIDTYHVLTSLENVYRMNPTKRCVPITTAYNLYLGAVPLGEPALGPTKYRRVLAELGCVIDTGGGNRVKIYDLKRIPAILDANDYL